MKKQCPTSGELLFALKHDRFILCKDSWSDIFLLWVFNILNKVIVCIYKWLYCFGLQTWLTVLLATCQIVSNWFQQFQFIILIFIAVSVLSLSRRILFRCTRSCTLTSSHSWSSTRRN
jgi:hypothetical protein